jgi:mRNA interferase MazF
VNRGEIWWVEDPDAGRRPHLILTRQGAIPILNRVVAVPATRRIRNIPTEVRLDEDDGMPAPCALTLDNLVTLPKSYFIDRITRLGVERLDEVCRALSAATGC